MIPQSQAISIPATRAGPVPSAHALSLVGGAPATDDHALAARMREVVGQATYKEIAKLTGTHPETVRRYFIGGRPSVSFLGAFCSAYRVSADWLLDGLGERQRDLRMVHPARDQAPAGPPAVGEAEPPRPAAAISGRARTKRL